MDGSPLYLRLLDKPKLVVNGHAAPLGTREAGLLSYLWDRSPRAVWREQLVSLLWPRVALPNGLQSLSQTLYQLRRKAPFLPIEADAKRIRLLRLHADVDDLRAAVLEGAWLKGLQLYQRPFLDGCDMPTPELDAWKTSQDVEVAELVTQCLLLGLPASEHQDERRQIAVTAEVLLSSPGATSAAADTRVLSLLSLGQLGKAQEEHRRLSSRFAGALTPFEQLHASIVQQCEIRTHSSTTSKFVGRTEEMHALMQAWRGAISENGSVVLVSGEPGIGKSRLVDQFLRRVAISGGRVWTTRCQPGSRRSPFAAIHELLESANALVDTTISADVKTTLSSLVQPFHDEPHLVDQSKLGWQHVIVSSLGRLIAEVALHRPLVVFVDDIQWADDLTAQVLTLWALHVPARRICLVYTLRTEDGDPLPDWIEYDLPVGTQVRLGQLSPDDSREMASDLEERLSLVLPTEQLEHILSRSGGRPLLLIECLKHAAQFAGPAAGRVPLPESVLQLMKRRFRGLSKNATWVMSLSAAFGDVEPHNLVDLSGLSDGLMAEAVDELGVRGILEIREGKLRFPHELLREAAYQSISPATRALVHGRIGGRLAACGAEPGSIAEHYAHASDPKRAQGFALRAARLAREEGRFSDSGYYYRLAIDASPEETQYVLARELAQHLTQVGRVGEAETLLPLLRAQSDSVEAALLADLIELERLLAGQSVAAALSHASCVLERAAQIEALDLGVVLGLLLDLAHDAGNEAFAADLLSRCTAVGSSRADSGFSTQVAVLSAAWLGATVGYKPALEKMHVYSADRIRSLPHVTQTLACYTTGSLHLLAGELDSATTTLARAAELAQAGGDIRRLSSANMNLAVALLEMGEFASAQRLLEGLIVSPNRLHKLRAYSNLAILHYESGSGPLAVSTAHALLSMNASYGSAKYGTTGSAIAGLVALESRDERGARTHFDRLADSSVAADYLQGDVGYTVTFVSQMLIAAGALSDAKTLVDRALALTSPRDHLAGMRLQLAYARLTAVTDRDRAYALAREVREAAVSRNAHCVGRSAARLLATLR